MLFQEKMVSFCVVNGMVQVMDSDAEGTASEFFDYFKVGLCCVLWILDILDFPVVKFTFGCRSCAYKDF